MRTLNPEAVESKTVSAGTAEHFSKWRGEGVTSDMKCLCVCVGRGIEEILLLLSFFIFSEKVGD